MTETTKATPRVGDLAEVEVFKITNFGAFVKFANNQKGLIHISQIADNFVKNIGDHLKIGDKITARIISVDGDKIDLSLKKQKEDINFYPKNKEFKSSALEDKLKLFLRDSEEKLGELRKNTESKQR
jgi:S1 RNA binding domain protein